MIKGLRHRDIYDPRKYESKRVAVIGVGTIGSHLALTLARMQIPLVIYDHDTVEEHNLATQSYTRSSIGAYKVEAVQRQCVAIGSEEEAVQAHACKFSSTDADIVVSCVDSLEARRTIAEALGEDSRPIHDGRVGAEQVEVYRFNNAREWLEALPLEADTDPCGARFTAYTANICAGLLANNIKRELLAQSVQQRLLYDAHTSSFLKP